MRGTPRIGITSENGGYWKLCWIALGAHTSLASWAGPRGGSSSRWSRGQRRVVRMWARGRPYEARRTEVCTQRRVRGEKGRYIAPIKSPCLPYTHTLSPLVHCNTQGT